MKKRVDEADILVGKIPYGLRTIWRGAHARPKLPNGRFVWPWKAPPMPKRKRGYYRALLRNEPWALELKAYLDKAKNFWKNFEGIE